MQRLNRPGKEGKRAAENCDDIVLAQQSSLSTASGGGGGLDGMGLWEQRWWWAVWLIRRRFITNTFARTDSKAQLFRTVLEDTFRERGSRSRVLLEKDAIPRLAGAAQIGAGDQRRQSPA